jgi:hypothetical protein
MPQAHARKAAAREQPLLADLRRSDLQVVTARSALREFCASDAFAMRYVAVRDRSEAEHNTFIHAAPVVETSTAQLCVEMSLANQDQRRRPKMRTRTSRLIEETLRQWDDYAAIEDEAGLECVMADVERQRTRKVNAAYSVEAEASIMGSSYTISSAWDTVESRQH